MYAVTFTLLVCVLVGGRRSYVQHDDLRVVKEPQGELGVADSAGDNQSRPLSKAAPGVLWAQTLTGGEHRPDPW